MTIKQAKRLTLDEFSRLDDGSEAKIKQNHSLKRAGESFMEFVKGGSEKLKSDPVIRAAFQQ